MPGRIAGQLATAPTAARLIFGTTKRDIKISLVVTRDIFTGFTAPLNCYF